MSFDSVDALLNNLNPQIVGSLKRAVELGKWPNGQSLSDEQKTLCVEAIASWEGRHLSAEERVGYVAPKQKKTPCGDKDDEQTLNWV